MDEFNYRSSRKYLKSFFYNTSSLSLLDSEELTIKQEHRRKFLQEINNNFIQTRKAFRILSRVKLEQFACFLLHFKLNFCSSINI